MSYIYLASPYSHSDESVRHARYVAVRDFVALLFKRNYLVFSPIVHCHDLAVHHELPKDAAFWKAYDTAMIRSAREFWVHTQPGWRESVGIAGEIKLAGQLFLPTLYAEPIGKEEFRIAKEAPVP